MKLFLHFCIVILFYTQHAKSQTSYTWNGTTSTSWNTTTNWTPNGIPGAIDNVTIVTGSNNCILAGNTSITNITLTSGTLNMNGFTLTASGNAVFTAGIIKTGTLTVSGAAGNTSTLTNPTLNADAVLNITTGAITLNSGTYGGPVTLTQTGTISTSGGTGGAIFNSTLSITNNSTGNFRMYGNNTYNGACTFINGSSAGDFLPELNRGSTYNSNLTLTNKSTTANMRMCYAGTTAFNGNIVLSNIGGANFYFCESGTATATLATGKTITIGTFNVGTLYLYRFTQTGTTAQTLSLAGNATINLNNSTTFNGALTVSSPNLYTSNCTYNGITTLTKTDGTTSNNFTGGNTFNNTLTINYTAVTNPMVNSYWGFAANTPDVYNGDLYVNNSSADRILWGVGASVGNQLNGNLVVTQTGSAIGIGLAWSAGTTWIQAAGKNISIGGAGFSVGYLGIGGLTTSSSINLTTTGTSAVYLGTLSGTTPCIFGNTVTILSPNIYTSNCTYNGITILTKSDGTTSNNMNGGNTFNSSLTINYTAVTNPTVNSYWGFAANTSDIYNGNVNVNNSSADRILWGVGGNSSVNTQYNGNLILTQTGSAVGIATAWSSGTSCTMSAGNTISIGGLGFSTGYLGICGLTTSSALNLTTTGASSIYLGNYAGTTPCTFGSTVNITAPDIYVRGGTYNSRAYFTKTGGTSDHNNGNQNIFNASCTINQQSSGGYFMLGYNSNEQFNDSIIVTSTGTGGIGLGWNSGTGTPTLASGKSVFIGAAGFSAGYLRFGGFTQLGSTPINLTLTGTAQLYINNTSSNSTFNAVFNVTAPDITIQGGTFNGRAIFTKTGGTNDYGNGVQNIYNASCNINQQSNGGFFLLSYNSNDLFNDSIIVTSTGTGGIGLGWNGGTGTPTLAAGKSVFVGSAGFSAGYLRFGTFTQLGNAPINLTFTGATTSIYLDNHSVFGGNITTNSPDVYFDGCTFNGTVNATKTGATSDAGSGGNIFQQASIFNNTGAGYLIFGNGTADIWNAAVIFNNSGSNYIYPAYNSAGNLFNGSIVVSSTGSAANTGIQFCAAAAATATLAAGQTISAGTFNIGNLYINRFTQLGPTAQNISLTGSATINVNNSSTFNGALTISSPNVYTSNSTYNGVTVLTKTDGTTSNNFAGGNIFNNTLTINYTATNAVGVYWGFGSGTSDTYNGDVYVNNSSTDRILWGVSASAGTQFNGNLIVTQTGSGVGIATAWAAGSTCTLGAGKTISIGAAGFTTGYLGLCGLTQNGSAPITLTTTGSSSIYVGQFAGVAPSVFGGVTTLTAPDIYIRGGTFNSRAYFIKTGGTSDNNNQQQNIFNASCTINQQSSGGYFMLGYNSNDLFNDSIIVSSTGTGGIYFGANNNTGTPTLASGKSIFIGSAGFSAGGLYFNHFTQLGSTAVNLTLTGTASLYFQYSSVFGGNVTSVSPTLLFNGCTFSGTTNCTKNGNTNDAGTGNNIFTGVSTINNSGSGYLLFGNGSADQWITDVTFNNTGSSIIYPAYSSVGNSFGGNVFCNNVGSTGNATGIYFCSNTNATASVTGNLTINNNPASGTTNGVRVCEANNSSFTVGGTSSITNTNTNTSNYIRFSNGTGSTTTFNGAVTVTNNGTIGSTNVVHFGYTGSSVFNNNITLNSNGGTGIYFGNNGGNSTQANNYSINTSTYTGGALYIRNFSQTGPATGNTSNVSITGTNQLLTLSGCTFYDNLTGSSQEITVTNSTFNGTTNLTKVSGNANDAWNGGNTFNGTTTITNQATALALRMANATADAYNGNVSFIQTGTGLLQPSYNTNCTYAGNITVTSPAGVAITFGSGGASGISTMNGSAVAAQTINLGATGLNPIFTQFVMNNTGGGVTLNTLINVSTSLTLTSGLLNTTATNLLVMNNGSTAPALTSASTTYVNGPMKYQLAAANTTTTLNFPIGTSPDCRPAALTVRHSTATQYNYTAQLFNADPWVAFNSGAPYIATNMPSTVDTISAVHYWTINRTDNTGTSQPSANLAYSAGVYPLIQLNFGTNDFVYQGSNLTIVKNTSAAPAAWIDIGGTSALGSFSTPQAGSVTSTSSPSAFNSFSSFTLGSRYTGWNPLPIGLLSFNAVPDEENVDITWETSVEVNNNYFTVERSADGITFTELAKVFTKAPHGNSNIQLNYQAIDTNPLSGTSYYRLKQTDYNNNYKYFNVVPVKFENVFIYPNPASNVIYVNVSSNYDNATLKVIDELGRSAILQQTIFSAGKNIISTADLEPGIYYIIIDNNGNEVNKTKIIIQR